MKISSSVESVVSHFVSQGWEVYDFQKKTWEAISKGRSGIVNAPTGSGKTYALWGGLLAILLLSKKKKQPVIWITPMRSLAQEIALSAQKLSDDLGLSLRVGIRTGDTSSSVKTAQTKSMPDLLITTPESWHVLLANKNRDRLFKHTLAVVVDEWHELIGSKRGVMVELAISYVKGLQPDLLIWGISATIGNLEEAASVLLGNKEVQPLIIKSSIRKKIEVRSIIPPAMDQMPWRGHLGIHLLPHVVDLINQHETTLIFTNTRAQCEIWYQQLMHHHPELAGLVAMHHGSIKKETRLWVEQAIRDGKLKACVCTSSLDLGVDFAPVDGVVQVGGPKGVARFVQRAGRSGHRPGATSTIYFLPTHALELLESSALQKAVKDNKIEQRIPYSLCFDVLLQYLCTLAVGGGFYPEAIWRQLKSTHAYQYMTQGEWAWCLQFVVQGSPSLASYEEYKKVQVMPDGQYVIDQRGVAMRHRMSIGTIVAGQDINVKFVTGGYIGQIDEYFVRKLNRGDVFVFAGRTLEFVRLKGMIAQVRMAKKKTAKVSNWQGSRMPLSAQLGRLLREEISQLASGSTPEHKALADIVARQEQESCIPGENELLMERFETKEGYHLLVYPFEGRFVHEAMANLLAYRFSLLGPISFSIACNDYGFELLSDIPFDVQDMIDNDLLTIDHLSADVTAGINAAELAQRKFHDIAVISGMVFKGFPNKIIQTKHLQNSSSLLFKVFQDNEPDHLLLRQAYAETFEQQIEQQRLYDALTRIQKQEWVIKECTRPTPFSFPIITDRLRARMSSEKLIDRIKKMQIKWK